MNRPPSDTATRVLLAGGTGLVGALLTARLASRTDLTVDSLARRPRHASERPVDLAALAADPASSGDQPVDVAVSCLGTTLRAAGSPAAFRRVDHDYVVGFARAARHRGATRFVLVSSVGAGGSGLYLRTKGQTEEAVGKLGFLRLDLVRPSLLLGPRTDRRLAEGIGQRLAPLLSPLMRGGLERYAALDATVVAAAIERLLELAAPGVHTHHVPDLRALAQGM